MIDNDRLIVLAGATGCGKSAVAVKLAKEIDGEVINVDSIQLYKGFDIGSGKIPISEREGVPHHLIDIRDADNPINVSEFIELADNAVSDVIRRGKKAIVVAGTTLYLKSLLHGLAKIPGKDPKIRADLELLKTEELISILKSKDPSILLSISSTDRLRLIRAIEVELLTGTPLSLLHKQHSYQDIRYSTLVLHLCWTREDLYSRIDYRCNEMLKLGLIDETSKLRERYGESCLPLKSLGYAQALKFNQDTFDESMVLSEMRTKTRQFAKRQLTFWRNQPDELGWKVSPNSLEGSLLQSESKPLKKGQLLLDFQVYKLNFAKLLERLNSIPSSNSKNVELWSLAAKPLLEV